MHGAVETFKGSSQIGIVITGCCSGCFVPKQLRRCVSWICGRLSLSTGLLVTVKSGEHSCCYVGSFVCSQIHKQACFVAFVQASATALLRASPFWDVN
jgi:hypothetical protein